MTGYGTLVVRRPRAWSDIARAYRIEIDGHDVASIHQHHEERIRLTAGVHLLRARIDWTGSGPLAIVVPADGELVVTVRPAGGPGTAWSRLAATDGWIAVSVAAPRA